MKYYKKEDLKKIGYYRTEEQLQEKLKGLDYYCVAEAECVFERESIQIVKCLIVSKGGCEITLPMHVYPNEFLEVVNYDKLKKDYVSEDEVSTYLSKKGFKIEKLFHVTKENIDFITSFDGFRKKMILPNWLEEKIEESGIEYREDKYSYENMLFPPSFIKTQIYLTFKERIGYCTTISYRVNFGNYIALMSNGRLKELSKPDVPKLDD